MLVVDRLLDALYWCVPGGIGLQMVAVCYGEMQLHISRRFVMVGVRWDWVADGGAVSLGNAAADW